MNIIADRLAQLDTIQLAHGSHHNPADGLCAMEAAAWLAGEEHTDSPACVSPVIATFLRTWNDHLDDTGRQLIKPLLPKVIGTAGDGHDEARGWMCADWLVRVHTPAWLELAGITDAAEALRALPELRDSVSLDAAQAALDNGRRKADAAWDAAGAAAGAAAWDAARDAAWAAARAAAGAAAGAAARDAARDAARAAAWDALAPTREGLQASAVELVERMVLVGGRS